MASGVAHDFNNILASVLGRTELLLRETDDPSVERSLQVISQAAVDGAATVRRIQDFTRVSPEDDLQVVDLNEVVSAAFEVAMPRWKHQPVERGIDIELKANLGLLPPVSANPSELREVLINIIFNAVEAMPEGGIIEVDTYLRGAHATVTVSDSGIGMNEEVRRRIFDPFFTTRGEKGSGLGMSVAYGIINRHGGELLVESAPGRGTTVIIKLPVADRVAPEGADEEPEAGAGPHLGQAAANIGRRR